MTSERERVISITLSEAEWQAFIARHPQPVAWLRDKIRDEVRVPAAGEVSRLTLGGSRSFRTPSGPGGS